MNDSAVGQTRSLMQWWFTLAFSGSTDELLHSDRLLDQAKWRSKMLPHESNPSDMNYDE